MQVWLQPGPSGWLPEGSAPVDATEIIRLFSQGDYTGLVGVNVDQATRCPFAYRGRICAVRQSIPV